MTFNQPGINPLAFYHVTHTKSLPGIAKDGLLPADRIKDETQFRGWNGDHNYVYLFHHAYIEGIINSLLNGTNVNLAVLEIHLPNTIPIERDYHVATGFLERQESRTEADLINFLESFGIKFTGELTEENIKRHVDMIRDQDWPGMYRTPESIPPQYINFDRWAFLHAP